MPVNAMLFLLALIGSSGFIFYTYLSTRHKERMAIIEKGGDIKYPSRTANPYRSLKWGIILLCVGIGLSIGIAMDIGKNHDGPFYTIPLLIIGAGIGQLIYYRMRKNDEV